MKVITEQEYHKYLADIGKLMTKDPDPNSPEGVELMFLAKSIEDYEKVHFPIAEPGFFQRFWFRLKERCGW